LQQIEFAEIGIYLTNDPPKIIFISITAVMPSGLLPFRSITPRPKNFLHCNSHCFKSQQQSFDIPVQNNITIIKWWWCFVSHETKTPNFCSVFLGFFVMQYMMFHVKHCGTTVSLELSWLCFFMAKASWCLLI